MYSDETLKSLAFIPNFGRGLLRKASVLTSWREARSARAIGRECELSDSAEAADDASECIDALLRLLRYLRKCSGMATRLLQYCREEEIQGYESVLEK